ncbi:unnamed protein product [Sphagnum balticum]
MYSKFTSVTPAEATLWLDTKNAHNRPISQSTVERYTQEMKANRWKSNGQAIVFSKSGQLVNGQHRLKACIAANKSFDTLIVWGVDDDAFDTIDDGNKRSLADVLAIKGEHNFRLLSTGVRFLWVYATGQVETRDLRRGTIATKPLLEETLRKHPGLRQSTKYYSLLKSRPGGMLIPSGMAIGLHYLFSLVNEQKADQFFSIVQSGIGLEEGHPILALRARLISGKVESSSNLTDPAIYFYVVTTWNAFAADQPLRRLAFIRDQPPPEIDNLPKKLLKDLL